MDLAYIKALHIIFVVSWFAGLFYIVRLFIYFAEAEEKEDNDTAKMDVTDADKRANTTAYKRMKAGDKRYNDKTTKKESYEDYLTKLKDVSDNWGK